MTKKEKPLLRLMKQRYGKNDLKKKIKFDSSFQDQQKSANSSFDNSKCMLIEQHIEPEQNSTSNNAIKQKTSMQKSELLPYKNTCLPHKNLVQSTKTKTETITINTLKEQQFEQNKINLKNFETNNDQYLPKALNVEQIEFVLIQPAKQSDDHYCQTDNTNIQNVQVKATIISDLQINQIQKVSQNNLVESVSRDLKHQLNEAYDYPEDGHNEGSQTEQQICKLKIMGSNRSQKTQKLSEENLQILLKSIEYLQAKSQQNLKNIGKIEELPKKVEDFSLDEDIEPISYQKLVNHINQMHPQKPDNERFEAKTLGQSFGLFDPIGNLLFSTQCGCMKQNKNVEHDQNSRNVCLQQNNYVKDQPEDEITPMAKEIGLGSTLFLMNINALMYFFALLTIINIPLMIIFANGSSTYEGINSAFVSLSLGNLGGRTEACTLINLRALYGTSAINKNLNEAANFRNYQLINNLTLKCTQGNHLGRLKLLGFYYGEGNICQNVNKFEPDEVLTVFDQECFYNRTIDTLFEPIKIDDQINTQIYRTFLQTYQSFLNGQGDSISIPFFTGYINQNNTQNQNFVSSNPSKNQFLFIQPQNMLLGYQISAKCYNKLIQKASTQYDSKNPNEPQVIMISQCLPNPVINPITNKQISRSQLGLMITFLDFLNIFLIITFTIWMKKAQLTYIHKFKSKTLDISDFVIKITEIPHQDEYEDVETLRSALILYFENLVIQRRAIRDAKAPDQSYYSQEDEDQYFVNKQGDAISKNIVADVCFIQSNLDHAIPLLAMQDARQSVLRAKRSLEKTQNGCLRSYLQKQKKQSEKAFEKQINLYYEATFLSQQKNNIQSNKPNVLVQSENAQENDCINILKDQKQLKNKYSKQQEINSAYIIFRQISDVNLLFHMYKKYTKSKRNCINCLFWFQCHHPRVQKQRKEYQSLVFKGAFLEPGLMEFGQVSWGGVGVTRVRRLIGQGFTWCIGVLLVAVGVIGVVNIKLQSELNQMEMVIKISCGGNSGDDIFKQMVIQDQLFKNGNGQYLHLRNCYCPARFKIDSFLIKNIEFDIPYGNGTSHKMYLCSEWLIQYLSVQAVVPASAIIIVILNMIIAKFVIYMRFLEKMATEDEETRNTFIKLQILQFMNSALIILSVNFNFYENRNQWFLGFIPIFDGKFKDFEPDWYNKVGAILCLTMFIQIFLPYVQNIFMVIIYKIRQCIDRGGINVPLEKSQGEIDKVDINTKQLMQDDLNNLYTGPEIPVHYVYSQQFTSIWCLLMFSTGMPVMYLIGSGVFFSFFLVNKELILKFYKKSTKFNHEMALQNQFYTEIAILLHVIVGGIMISQPDIFLDSDIETQTLKDQQNQSLNESKFIQQQFIDVFTNVLGQEMASNFFSRYFQTVHAKIYFAFVFLLLAWFISKMTDINLIENIFNCIIISCKCCKKLRCTQKPKFKKVLSNNFYADLDIENLRNLYESSLQENDRINELQEFQQNYNECKYFLKEVKEQIETRCKIIEKTIDDHLLLLHEDDGLDEINQKEGVTYAVKLMYLESYAEQLKASGKVCRMANLSQSFDIQQSLMYKKCKTLQLEIEKKINNQDQ